jgi:hypothetical protein
MANPTKLDASPSKPLLFADERTDAERFDPRLHRGHLDPSRIPGYSEIVQANDIAKADDLIFRERNAGRTKEHFYKQIGASPQPLPVEFMWLRVSGPRGLESPSAMRDLDRYEHAEGFRLASRADLENHGYGFPPAAREAEDGTIRRGPDVALYVRSGEVARMWEAAKIADQAELAGAPAAFNAGAYSAEAFDAAEKRETITVKH